MTDTPILCDDQEVSGGAKSLSKTNFQTLGKHHSTIEAHPDEGLSEKGIIQDLNAGSGCQFVLCRPESNDALNSRQVPGLNSCVSGETISRVIPRDSARETLSQSIKEITNLAPIIKEYIFDHPGTVSEFYQAEQTVHMEDANFDMDFLYVTKGSIEVFLELQPAYRHLNDQHIQQINQESTISLAAKSQKVGGIKSAGRGTPSKAAGSQQMIDSAMYSSTAALTTPEFSLTVEAGENINSTTFNQGEAYVNKNRLGRTPQSLQGLIKSYQTASQNQFSSGKSLKTGSEAKSTQYAGSVGVSVNAKTHALLVPNICFGYRVKYIKVTTPGTETLRIKNIVYRQFIEQSVAFRWSEKEMREAMDVELQLEPGLMKARKDQLFSLFKLEKYSAKDLVLKWGELPDKIIIVLEGELGIYRKIGDEALDEPRSINWYKEPETRIDDCIMRGDFGVKVCQKELTFKNSDSPLYTVGEETDLLEIVSPFTYIAQKELLCLTVPSKALLQWMLSSSTKTFMKMKKRATQKVERLTEMAIEVDKMSKHKIQNARIGVIGNVKTTDAHSRLPVAEHNIIRVIETFNKQKTLAGLKVKRGQVQNKPTSGYITQSDLMHLEKTRREIYLDWGKTKNVLSLLKKKKLTGQPVGYVEPISALPDKSVRNQVDYAGLPMSYSSVVDPTEVINYKDYGVECIAPGHKFMQRTVNQYYEAVQSKAKEREELLAKVSDQKERQLNSKAYPTSSFFINKQSWNPSLFESKQNFGQAEKHRMMSDPRAISTLKHGNLMENRQILLQKTPMRDDKTKRMMMQEHALSSPQWFQPNQSSATSTPLPRHDLAYGSQDVYDNLPSSPIIIQRSPNKQHTGIKFFDSQQQAMQIQQAKSKMKSFAGPELDSVLKSSVSAISGPTRDAETRGTTAGLLSTANQGNGQRSGQRNKNYLMSASPKTTSHGKQNFGATNTSSGTQKHMMQTDFSFFLNQQLEFSKPGFCHNKRNSMNSTSNRNANQKQACQFPMKSANQTPGYSPKKMKWDQSRMFNSKMNLMSMNLGSAKESMRGNSIEASSNQAFPDDKISSRRQSLGAPFQKRQA